MTNTKQIRLPAEWEPQQAIIFSWPHNQETWPVQMKGVLSAYAQFIKEVSATQKVWVLVASDQMETEAKRFLIQKCILNNNVEFHVIPTYDAWVRDYGPISVYAKSKLQFTSWVFDGWGGKYDEQYSLDSFVPQKISQTKNIPMNEIDFILEGGSIDSNGEGCLLTTKDCLLNQNRNATFTQTQIESLLCEKLGVKKVIWLEAEIKGDDTDGHVDDAARFVDARTIVCVCEDDPSDDNFEPTQSLFRQLSSMTDQNGRPFVVHKLPMPDPVLFDDMRLPASYANFLITNDKVLVPIYDCPQDQVALKILSELFHTRQVVGIDCRDIVYGLGAIHCLSMQVPQGE